MISLPDLAGTWTLDPSHSRIGFSARHAMVTKVRGPFTDASGSLVIDPRGLEHSHVEISVRTASVDTRTPDRDAHLRSPDFFDAERHPEITFRSTEIIEHGERTYLVVGQLTIKDVTQQFILPIELIGVDVDPFGNTRAGLEGTHRIDRRTFGLEWNTPLDSGGVLVSERINLEFELSLIRSAA